MGDHLVTPTHGNTEGHYECAILVELNDLILAEMGYSWRNPPPTNWVEYHVPEFLPRAQAYITNRGEPPWGMKDPRVTLLLPLWLEAFTSMNIDVITIAVGRDVHRIADSYVRRANPTDPTYEQALDLTLAYHRRMV